MSETSNSIARLLAVLNQNPFFAPVASEDLIRLLRRARLKQYAVGAAVFHEGEPSEGLFWLQAGTLKAVKYSTTGREQILHLVQAGQTFNEIGAFSTLPNPATIVALTEAEIWHVPGIDIQALVAANPAFAQSVINLLAQRLRHTVTLIEDLSLRPVLNRLARLILSEAVDDVVERPHWYTQNELAARLGTVTDVVQRALRKLDAEQIIHVDRQQIRILDRQQLQTLAD